MGEGACKDGMMGHVTVDVWGLGLGLDHEAYGQVVTSPAVGQKQLE